MTCKNCKYWDELGRCHKIREGIRPMIVDGRRGGVEIEIATNKNFSCIYFYSLERGKL